MTKELLHDLIGVLYRHLGPRATPEAGRRHILDQAKKLVNSYEACGPVMQGCPLRGKAPCRRHANTEAS